MASIVIRSLDEALKARLRMQAAMHGRSMEDEARDILHSVLSLHPRPPENPAEVMHSRFAALGGFDMPPIEREYPREPPAFDA